MEKDKQDIGQVFKERLSNVSISPNKIIWNNIEKELKTQRKRSFLYWLYLSTATLLVLSTLILVSKGNFTSQEKILPEETIDQKNSHSLEKNADTFNNSSNPENKITHIKKDTSTIKSEQEKNTSDTISYSGNISRKTRRSTKEEKNKTHKIITNINSKNTDSLKEKSMVRNNRLSVIKSKNIVNNTSKNAFQKEEKTALRPGSNINNNSKNTTVSALKNRKIKAALDSITKNNITEKSIINKKIEKEKMDKKIGISFYIAPTVLNPFTNKSTLDERLDTLPSTSRIKLINKITLSYGAYFKFKINNRLGFRLGAGVLNLEKATENIATNGMINFESFNILSLPINPGMNITDAQIASFFNNNPVTLTQKISYFEVPLEFNYSLIDKKLKLDLIAGFSSLFLTENQIQAKGNNNALIIGKASNLSEFNFSLNIGTGIYYDLTKKIRLSVEPLLKYQINARTGNTNAAGLYHFSIQTGFIWRF